MNAPCRCLHPEDAHRHYRRGTECGICACTRYRPSWLTRIRNLIGAP